MARQGIPDTQLHLMQYFSDRIRSNLHMAICMSPLTETFKYDQFTWTISSVGLVGFRNYVRMYPALVNCTTVIYFAEWPHEALIAVAHHFLSKSTFVAENNEAVRATCNKSCWPAPYSACDRRPIERWPISAPSFTYHRKIWPYAWKMNSDGRFTLHRRITFNLSAITAGRSREKFFQKEKSLFIVCSKVKRPRFRSNTIVSRWVSSKWPKPERKWRRSPWNWRRRRFSFHNYSASVKSS